MNNQNNSSAPGLLPCPFCGGAARIESNRDWHKLRGDHDDDCVFVEPVTLAVPATDEQLAALVADWNRRATHPFADRVQGGLTDEQIIQIKTECGWRYNSLWDLSDSGACEFARAILSRQSPAPTEVRARIKQDCDCGCNDPVATTPLGMLEFLAGRFEFAGVSHAVAEVYAHDIRKILASHGPDETLSRQSMRGGEAQAEPKMTVRDGIWWPEGYCRDPNGVIVAPAGKHADFKFGYDVGYAEGLVAHKDSVSAIESRVAAEQAAAPEGCDTIEKAAWILECYHAYLQALSPINFDEHPYIPEIEGTAKDLRAMLAAAPSLQEGNAAKRTTLECPTCGYDRFLKPCGNPSNCGMIGTAQQSTPANAAAANGDGLALRLAKEALEVVQRSYGIQLTSYPPKDAWLVNRVDEKVRVALAAINNAAPAADADDQKGGQHG